MVNFNKSKEIILGIFIVCVSILLIICLLEIILRIYPIMEIAINNPYQYTKTKGQVRFGMPFNTYSEIYPLQFDSRVYYKKSSGVIDYHFNQFGARWLQPKVQKVSDRNIIVLGDSFTYGFGLRYEDVYIYKLQKSLNKGGLNVNFINFSTPGTNSETCLTIYNRIKDSIHHDVVIYGLHLNDLIEFPTSYIISDIHKYDNWIRKWSKTMDFMFSRIEKIKSRHENIKKLLNLSNFEQPYFIDDMNAIKKLNIECKKRNRKFIVVILPVLIDLRKGTFKPVYDKIKNILIKNEIEYFDLSNSVCSYSDSTLWILPFDQHPNEIANRIYAEELGKFLINEMKD